MRGKEGDSPEGEYERHRVVVLGMLGKRFARLDPDERLAIYHDAWMRVLVKRERGEEIGSLRAYLLSTAAGEALHLLSRRRIPIPVGPDDPRLAALPDDAPAVDEQVVTRDQVRIARSLLDTLDERQRDVLKLRWDLQLSGAEVRAALGLTTRQYRRLAEEGAAALAARVEERESGQWSRRTRSLLVACLIEVTGDGERRVGIASRRQRAEAQRLLESDPHVAALYAEVRRTARGSAALLPLPVLAFPDAGGLAGVAEPLAASVDRVRDTVAAARDHLSHAASTAKHHATSVYLRAADPSQLAAAPRPGTAVVAITGLLVVGGGAYGTYKATTPPAPQRPTASQSHLTAAPQPATKPPTNVPNHAPASRAPKPHRTPKPPRPTRTTSSPTPPQPPPTPSSPTPNPPTQPTPTPQPNPTTEFGFED